MQDGVDRIVQKLAVVADDQRGVRIFLQSRFEPKCTLEVQIVGRFVEQQQFGLREQRGRQRYAHPPAAGELRHRAVEVGGGETQPAEDFGGARRRAVGVDFNQPLVDFGKLFGLRGLQPGIQRFPLDIGGQNCIEKADRRGRVLLVD